MKHKLITTLALGLTLTGAGVLANQTKASAATKYVWTKTKSYKSTTPAYHAKKQGQTAYLWNWNHTKKLHNSKNYPHTTWHVQQSVAMKHGKKTTIYYQVVSGNKKVTGYIYRGYLTKGKYQAPSNNVNNNLNNTDTDAYTDAYGVKSNRSRDELKKTILSIFSGATEDPKLTSIADDALNNRLDGIIDDDAISNNANNNYNDLIINLKEQTNGKLVEIKNETPYSDSEKKVSSFKDFVKSRLIDLGFDQNDYQGYKIGVSVVSKTERDYDIMDYGNLYGLFEVLLVPNN